MYFQLQLLTVRVLLITLSSNTSQYLRNYFIYKLIVLYTEALWMA